jgi:hypothetical protein
MATRRALNPSPGLPSPTKSQIQSLTCLMSVQLHHLSAVSTQHQVCRPPSQETGFLRSVKDDLELKTPGVRVYSIPCECGQAYIGQIDARLKQHQTHIRLEESFSTAGPRPGTSLSSYRKKKEFTRPRSDKG